MRLRKGVAVLLLMLLVAPFAAPLVASAAPANTDDQAQEKTTDKKKKEKKKEGDCAGGIPGVEQLCDGAEAVGSLPGQLQDAPGNLAEDVAESAVDQMTQWMIDAAVWTTKQIVKGIQETTTPELESSWYEERYKSMASLGLGLAMLVAMIALISAAIRRDPDALGATVVGMFRAGVGTGLVIALTIIGLTVADGITNTLAGDTIGKNADQFWTEVAEAWGQDDFGGIGSSAVAFLMAFMQVVAGLLVWIELLVRSAAIYVAVLFMPMALAAGIWPAMRQWQTRLAKTLFVLIALKPVVVTVLALAGYAAKAGLTGEADKDIGVLLSAVVIFALAALSPWALMSMINVSAEGTSTARGGAAGARESTSRVGGALSSGCSGTRDGGGAGGSRAGRASGGGSAGASFGSGGGSSGGDSNGNDRKPPGGGGGGGLGKGGGGFGRGGGGDGSLHSTGAVAAAAGLGVSAAQGAKRGIEDRATPPSGGGGGSSGGADGGARSTAAAQQRSAQPSSGAGSPGGGGGGASGSQTSRARTTARQQSGPGQAKAKAKPSPPPRPSQSGPRPRPVAPNPRPRKR